MGWGGVTGALVERDRIFIGLKDNIFRRVKMTAKFEKGKKMDKNYFLLGVF